RLVMLDGKEVKLTPREYDLLRLLVQHAGKVLTHKFLLKEIWGGETDVQYLRIYVRGLRQKIESDPEQPRLILTEQGVGYRLKADGASRDRQRRVKWSGGPFQAASAASLGERRGPCHNAARRGIHETHIPHFAFGRAADVCMRREPVKRSR